MTFRLRAGEIPVLGWAWRRYWILTLRRSLVAQRARDGGGNGGEFCRCFVSSRTVTMVDFGSIFGVAVAGPR